MARRRGDGHRLNPKELRQALTSLLESVPAGITDRQARLLLEHLQWLNGRLPSKLYAEAQKDFSCAPISGLKSRPRFGNPRPPDCTFTTKVRRGNTVVCLTGTR